MYQCPTCKQQAALLPEFEAILNNESEYYYRNAEMNQEYYYRQAELNAESEIVGSQDTRKKVTDTTVAPFRYICQIKGDIGDGWTSIGSGFFIGPKTILTAGHVVWNEKTNSRIPLNKITISPALNGTTMPIVATAIQPVNVVFSKTAFSNSDITTANDYAIIHVANSFAGTVGHFGMAKWAKDDVGSSILSSGVLPLPASQLSFNVCGYPGDKGGHLQYTTYNAAYQLAENNKILTYYNDTKGGQSGGPVWIKRDPSMGGRVIVGIHISAGPSANSPVGTVKYNRAVFITKEVNSFIDRNLR